MKTELNIQAIPVERGRIAATLSVEKSAQTIAVSDASAEVICRFVGTAIAPYFIVPDTRHMQQAFDFAQVDLPELRIQMNRVLSARDPADAADSMQVLIDRMSLGDSASAIVIRPYDWIMMNMLKHAENLQASIAGLYYDLAPNGQGRILGQAAFDLSNAMTGITDEEYARIPTAPQISDLLGKTVRGTPARKTMELKLSHAVILSADSGTKTALALVPRRAGGAFLMEVSLTPAQFAALEKKRSQRRKDEKGEKDNELIQDDLEVKDVTLTVKRVLRYGLFYRSGAAHYVSPLKELLLIRLLIHFQKIMQGERPVSSNYRYYESPAKMIAKLQAVFLRIASDSLITATGDLSDYLSSEDGRILLEGSNLAYGYDSMPLFLALLACSDSIKTLEQMLILSQQDRGGVVKISDVTPPVDLEPRFVRWVAEVLLNPVLEYRNQVLQDAGIADVASFVTDPSFVTGGPDLAGITGDNDPQALHESGTIFGLDRVQLASVTELIRLEIGDMLSGEASFVECLTGKYSRVKSVRYNGRHRDLDHLKRLLEAHMSVLRHIIPSSDAIRSEATLPYRQIGFNGPYCAYLFGRTVLPIQYGVFDLGKRLSRQLNAFAKVPAPGVTDPRPKEEDMVDIFSYIDSSIYRYEPRYMFPFYVASIKGKGSVAEVKRIDFEGHGGHVYAISEGANQDAVMSELVSGDAASKFWVNTAPFAQQYREVGLVTPCWDVDTFELLSNVTEMPTDRTYFPAVKPGGLGTRISMSLVYDKMDSALQRMLELEFVPKMGKITREVSIDKLPALSGIGVIMPYVSRLVHDLHAEEMDDFAMVKISEGIYGTAGTLVMPRLQSYAMMSAQVDESDAWRAPALDKGFSFTSDPAPYQKAPIHFDAE